MRVLLISANTATSPYPLYPLGCSMVAAALANAGHEVRQFCFLKEQTSFESLAREVRVFSPELIGISIRNIDNVNYLSEQRYIDTVTAMVSEIRHHSTATILLGGPGFSLIPERILEETGADFGIIGEGESLAVDFAANAAKGSYPDTRLLGPEKRLSGTAIPTALYDRDILDFYLRNGSMASIQTKRGCEHGCVYCTYPTLEGKVIRKRDAGAVVDDMEHLRENMGVQYVFFTDSVFNDDSGTYLDIIAEMERRSFSMPWTAFLKPTGLNEQAVARMVRTGLISAEIGSDAATDITLKRMGKGFTFGEIRNCNDLLVSQGVAAAHFFMFGGPGETDETVKEGIANILSLQGSISFIFLGVRILPNTPLARLALEEGLLKPGQDLLEPAYYFSPNLDPDWAEKTLTEAFRNVTHCVFPPDSMDDKLKLLHKLGYFGPLWDLLGDRKKAPVSRKGARLA